VTGWVPADAGADRWGRLCPFFVPEDNGLSV